MEEEQLEDKIETYRSGAKRALIAAIVTTTGFSFDYGIVDEIMVMGGAFMFGRNIRNAINYVRYSLKGE